MTFKTMAQLNAAEPHLRDLEITVDGLNVLDIQLPGPGAWAPRFTVHFSGDQGINETTGGRYVYLAAAEYLRAVLLKNGTGDGKTDNAFVPHANISREDLDGDINDAVAVANQAIARLLATYNGTDAENDGLPIEDDVISVYGKGLHIVIRTVDFNLTERRILDSASFEKLVTMTESAADPSPELVNLMGNQDASTTLREPTEAVDPALHELMSEQGFVVQPRNDVSPTPSPIGNTLDLSDELTTTNVTKFFNGERHKAILLKGGFNAPDQVFWVPEDRVSEFPGLEAINVGTVLTCVGNGNNYVEYLVYLPDANEIEPVFNNTEKAFNGVPHSKAQSDFNGRPVIVWYPTGMVIDGIDLGLMLQYGIAVPVSQPGATIDEFRLDLTEGFSAANASAFQLIDNIPHVRATLTSDGEEAIYWIPLRMRENFDVETYPKTLRRLISIQEGVSEYQVTHEGFVVRNEDGDVTWRIWAPVKAGLNITDASDVHDKAKLVTLEEHDDGSVDWELKVD